jgi:hypothetical protein
MTILFTVSSFLLVIFFSAKIWEVRSGQRMFMSDLRLRADKMITKSVCSASAYFKSGAHQVSVYSTDTIKRFRNSFSSWLERLARKIRQ